MGQADDSMGALGGCIHFALDGLHQVAEQLGPAGREKMFDYCLGESPKEPYSGWDLGWDLVTLAAELAETVIQGNIARLTSIPGVGRKTAERMMVEMRDKLPTLALGQEVAAPVKDAATEALAEDALSALLNLGYKKGVAQRAIEEARQRLKGEITLESLLKESLRSMV